MEQEGDPGHRAKYREEGGGPQRLHLRWGGNPNWGREADPTGACSSEQSCADFSAGLYPKGART